MSQSDDVMNALRDELRARPQVEELEWSRIIDSLGDPAYWITVVLNGRSGDWDRRWSELKPIKNAISARFREAGITDFPYVRFVTSDEFAAEKAAR